MVVLLLLLLVSGGGAFPWQALLVVVMVVVVELLPSMERQPVEHGTGKMSFQCRVVATYYARIASPLIRFKSFFVLCTLDGPQEAEEKIESFDRFLHAALTCEK